MKSKLIYLTVALAAIILSAAVWWWLQSPKPTFRQVSFKHLPGWENAQLKKSLETFQTSCRAFLKQNPERVVGTEQIDLQAKDWHPACRAALKINPVDEQSAKVFFEKWFAPVEFYDDKPVKGLFTGYYMPLIKGSYTKSEEFSVPIYELPSNLVTVDLGLFLPNLKTRKSLDELRVIKSYHFTLENKLIKGQLKTQHVFWSGSIAL